MLETLSGHGADNIIVWYAKVFGISDLDISESDWLSHWVKRHHNSLQYHPETFTWTWLTSEPDRSHQNAHHRHHEANHCC